MRPQLIHAHQTGCDGDGADTVGFRGANVVGMIADQRNARGTADPTLLARAPDGNPYQASAILGELGESPKPEVRLQAGAFHLPPADPRQVTGDQSDHG